MEFFWLSDFYKYWVDIRIYFKNKPKKSSKLLSLTQLFGNVITIFSTTMILCTTCLCLYVWHISTKRSLCIGKIFWHLWTIMRAHALFCHAKLRMEYILVPKFDLWVQQNRHKTRYARNFLTLSEVILNHFNIFAQTLHF